MQNEQRVITDYCIANWDIEDYNIKCAKFLNKDIVQNNMIMVDGKWTLMKYDSDWNCIMEVLEEIEKSIYCSVTFQKREACLYDTQIINSYKSYNTCNILTRNNNKRFGVTLAIYEYLKWYFKNFN